MNLENKPELRLTNEEFAGKVQTLLPEGWDNKDLDIAICAVAELEGYPLQAIRMRNGELAFYNVSMPKEWNLSHLFATDNIYWDEIAYSWTL